MTGFEKVWDNFKITEEMLYELTHNKGPDIEDELDHVVSSTQLESFTNSPLVNLTLISPNKSVPRKSPISGIAIHHCGGRIDIYNLGHIFQPKEREASSQYGIGFDAQVGMYVEEKDRSWCTNSGTVDNRCVTIEVSNAAYGEPWMVSDIVMAKLIELCIDICKRNNIPKLYYDGTINGSLVVHRLVVKTICPGTYLMSKLDYICNEVNKGLGMTELERILTDPKNKPSDWAKEVWVEAAKLGIVDGTRPKDNVTREELAAIALRILKMK